MDRTDTAKLLTYIAGLDPRMAADGDAAITRVNAWARRLAAYDVSEAVKAVDRYYGDPSRVYPITINEVVAGSRPSQHQWEEKASHLALVGRTVPMPDEVKRLAGIDPLTSAARKFPCPWDACKASAGNPCTVEGNPMKDNQVHPSRADLGRVSA